MKGLLPASRRDEIIAIWGTMIHLRLSVLDNEPWRFCTYHMPKDNAWAVSLLPNES